MISASFNSECLLTRPFAREDAPRIMAWAVLKPPSFIEGETLNNAFGARAHIERFLAKASQVVAIEPTKNFKDETGITLAGAIGALNLDTGEVYIDPDYADRAPLKTAITYLAQKHTPNAA